jgi:signal transduction histidine kinase
VKAAELVIEGARRQAVEALDELRDTQNQLIVAENLRSIGSLAAGVAHEINTPLQYVTDNVRFLQGAGSLLSQLSAHARDLADLADPSPELEAYRNLLEETDLPFVLEEMPKAIADTIEGLERLSSIVMALKQFAHPGGVEIAPCSLNDLLERTTTVARNEWRYVADLALDLGPGLSEVPVAAGPMSQAILNLVVNAAHAIEEAHRTPETGGKICVVSRREGDRAVVRVTDNGCGMSEEILSRVWDPFFTTKDVGRGTGQGLTIARRVIVDQHKGQLTVESEPGHGTTFVIELPIADNWHD